VHYKGGGQEGEIPTSKGKQIGKQKEKKPYVHVIAAAILLDVDVALGTLLRLLPEPLQGFVEEVEVLPARAKVRRLLAPDTEAKVAGGALSLVPPEADHYCVTTALSRTPHNIRHAVERPVEENPVKAGPLLPGHQVPHQQRGDCPGGAGGIRAPNEVERPVGDVHREEVTQAVATELVGGLADLNKGVMGNLREADLASGECWKGHSSSSSSSSSSSGSRKEVLESSELGQE